MGETSIGGFALSVALQMADRDGERVILMSGTYYAPKVFIKHIQKDVNAPKESFDQKL